MKLLQCILLSPDKSFELYYFIIDLHKSNKSPLPVLLVTIAYSWGYLRRMEQALYALGKTFNKKT